MPKRSSILWAAAILTTVAPDIYFRVAPMWSGAEGGVFFSWVSWGRCTGYEVDSQLQSLLDPVWDFPLLWFGSAPLIALAWGGRLLSERTGRPRLGRILAHSAVTVMIVRHLPSPLLFMLDASADRRCMESWGPLEVTGWGITMDLYYLVPVALVLLAVRTPGPSRRGRLARTGTAVSLAIMIIIGAVADTAAGKVSDSQTLDCAGFGDGVASELDGREKGFLCGIRDGAFGEGVPQLADLPDRELLAYGRHLCELAVRNGGDINAPAVSKVIGEMNSLVGPLTRLCPKVAEVEQERERQRQAENDAFIAAAEKSCAAHPRHRPRIKPVRQVRATMWTEFWHINAWDEGSEGGEVGDMIADLVGSGPGALNIWAADEIGHACVTGEAYRRRPPVETRGWEQVVEVGYETAKGVMVIVDGEGGRLPNLAAGGPGSYRVRVHVRGRKTAQEHIDAPDGTVQLLIMVFPGAEKNPVIYRDYPPRRPRK
ncbi:hypothetical protein [Streptosporangium roseum]|uniref:Uncharacterized protein n=1 Tax=Streptosporangium roseum (strain ATCC 12428 / DSM 43021 / JCM 3005 / KCTC 9067 / NCIMB 10171 / NRRL 2505 / NI 9100) TaxID=479432 RepID=D2B5T2_STRRD|nr:hypothetical protein [Streptosporangium roseum]ACZ91386.1 hypothetical protein Sros_8750 [Streptosporangium roseum DSM 43021]